MKTTISSLLFLCLSFNIYAQNEVKYFWSGAITSTSAKVNAKLTNPSTQVRLVVSNSSSLTSPLYSGYATANDANSKMAALSISGLTPNTLYYYAIESDGVVDNSADDIGSFRTFNTGAFSYTFVVGACANSSDHTVYTVMKNLNPLFYLNTGDLHYANPNSTDVNVHRAAYETEVLSKATAASLLKTTPIAYIWDDHDFSGDNSTGSSTGKSSARQAYREYVPHYPLAAGSGDAAIYQSFTVGRIKFILSDLRSERINGKIMSSTQMQWLKNEITTGANQNQIIAWISGVSFSGNISDNWGGFTGERTEISNYLKSQNIKNFFIISGDAHMLAIDNGNNTDFSTNNDNPNKYPIFQAAALNRPGSNKGGTYSEGAYPNPSSTDGQFGLVTVTDNGGDEICIKFTGYRVTSGSTSSSKVVEYIFCRTITSALTVSGSTLEAESASLSGAVVANNNRGYTGSGFVDYINASQDYIEWSYNTTLVGLHNLTFRYAHGSTSDRSLRLEVNNTTISSALKFTPTGGWSTWKTISINASLISGINKIRLTATGTSGPNVDNLKITSSSSAKYEEQNIENEVELYPNPVQNQLQVVLWSDNKVVKILKILDSNGNTLFTKNLQLKAGKNEEEIDLSNYENGMYYLYISEYNSRKEVIKKFIISK